ncbi:MAG: hypothetical protein JKY96_09455 [Phycisphaerales bacterium]|nr:hypothetical protein [Phycisphaerales bacterium]
MQTLILISWAIVGLLACWSFSLLVRGVSEVLARKRTHLDARRSTRALMMGFVLMVVCAGVALLAGWAAVYLEPLYNNGNTPLATPLVVIGASVSLFAACLVVWGAIGDRARGRARCPKCWYDMSGATGLQCPECGRTAKDETKFTKARRPRWAFAVALVLVVPGVYSIMVSKRVIEFGAFGAVPTWFLMMGWERLPEPWIYDNYVVPPVYGCLTDRLDEEWTSDARLARFRAKLIRPMVSSKEARWDPKRLFILDEFYSSEEFESKLHSIENTDKIFVGVATDVFEAITASNRTPLDNIIISTAVNSWNTEGGYYGTRSWFLQQNGFSDPDDFLLTSPRTAQTRRLISDLLQSLRERMENVNIPGLLIHDNNGIAACAQLIVLDTGLMNEFIYSYLDKINTATDRQQLNYAISIGMSLESVSQETQNGVFGLLKEWVESGDDSERFLALKTIRIFQHMAEARDDYDNPAYHQLMKSVLDFAYLDIRTTKSGSTDERSSNSEAAQAVAYHDTEGTIAFPLFRSLLIKECHAPYLYLSQMENKLAAQLWLNYFTEFADSPDPTVRLWVIRSTPSWMEDNSSSNSDKALNEKLNQFAADFLSDPDEGVAVAAQYKLIDRDAEHLIPQSND